MRAISCNNWINSNWGPHILMPTPITNLWILANSNNLYYLWFYESRIEIYTLELDKLYVSIDLFYYKLTFLSTRFTIN